LATNVFFLVTSGVSFVVVLSLVYWSNQNKLQITTIITSKL